MWDEQQLLDLAIADLDTPLFPKEHRGSRTTTDSSEQTKLKRKAAAHQQNKKAKAKAKAKTKHVAANMADPDMHTQHGTTDAGNPDTKATSWHTDWMERHADKLSLIPKEHVGKPVHYCFPSQRPRPAPPPTCPRPCPLSR